MTDVYIIYPKQAHSADPSIGQKAYAFLNKLTEDHTAPGLHIEPVKNAADKRCRTGRVDQQYRALMFKLTSDNAVHYVIHGIYNHDDAYNKAAKVRLTTNPINGLPEFLDEEPSQKSPEPVPPVVTQPDAPAPEPLIAFSAEDLQVSLGLPGEVAEMAVGITSDAAMIAYTEGLPEWQGLALLALASGDSITTVMEELELQRAEKVEGKPADVSDQDIIDSFDQPAAQMEFAKLKGAEELRRVITGGDFSAWRVFLHPQQRRWARNSWNGSARLAGGAGTGKTVVLVHRARMLAKRTPSAPMLVTTFTTNLADELRRSLERLDQRLPFAGKLGEPGIHIRGIDATASEVLRTAGADIDHAVAQVLGAGRADIMGRTDPSAWKTALDRAGQDLDPKLRRTMFLVAEYEMVILAHRITDERGYLKVRRAGRGVGLSRTARKAVWSVVEAYRAAAREAGTLDFAEAASVAAAHLEQVGAPVQHVLVDEGQDLKPSHWQLIRALAHEGPDDIFIAEDGHQRIYGQRLVLSHFGIRTQGRSWRLRLNYRTTAQNLAWAVGVLSGQAVFDSEGELDTMQGYQSARSGPAPRVASFATLTEELDHAAETIRGWVGHAGVAPETLAILVRDRATRSRVAAGLSERGVEVNELEAKSVKPGHPVVLTMHRAKGTEFTNVLLFGLSDGNVPMGLGAYDYDDEEKEAALLRERSLLYVAASRARDQLVVSYSSKPSQLLPGGV